VQIKSNYLAVWGQLCRGAMRLGFSPHKLSYATTFKMVVPVWNSCLQLGHIVPGSIWCHVLHVTLCTSIISTHSTPLFLFLSSKSPVEPVLNWSRNLNPSCPAVDLVYSSGPVSPTTIPAVPAQATPSATSIPTLLPPVLTHPINFQPTLSYQQKSH